MQTNQESVVAKECYEVSYYIPRIHISVTEEDVRYILMNCTEYLISLLPFPSRIDFTEIPNNKNFKSAFIYHECEYEDDIENAKKFKKLIKDSSNNENKQNFKINCGLLTPHNPNAYWIILPNHNQLSKYAKFMIDELNEIADYNNRCIYICTNSNTYFPMNLELYTEDEDVKIYNMKESENLIADKLQEAWKLKEHLVGLLIANNLPLPQDLEILYQFDKESDVILTY